MRTAKLGGKKDLRVFLKANDDVISSLLSQAQGGGRLRRGLSDLVSEKFGGTFVVDLIHEPCHRSDILLQQLECGRAPEELLRMAPELAGQFHTQLEQQPVDVIVLALQPEVVTSAWKHRRDGYLVCPPSRWREAWNLERLEWFTGRFEPVGLIPAPASAENFTRLVQRIKERLEAHVLVYNCSTVDPHDHIDNFHGQEDNNELRTHKLNLALMQLSVQEGISIIDVDRLIAEMGAQEHVQRWCEYSDEACDAIGQESLRVLEDIGFFENRPLVMQLGRKGAVRCS
jgi:hypothetical protein